MTELISMLIGRQTPGGSPRPPSVAEDNVVIGDASLLTEGMSEFSAAGELSQPGQLAALDEQYSRMESQVVNSEPAGLPDGIAHELLGSPPAGKSVRQFARQQVEPGPWLSGDANADVFASLLTMELVPQTESATVVADDIQPGDADADADVAADTAMDTLIASLLGLGRDVQAGKVDVPPRLDVNNPSQVAQAVRAIFAAAADGEPRLASPADTQLVQVAPAGQSMAVIATVHQAVDRTTGGPAEPVSPGPAMNSPLNVFAPAAAEAEQAVSSPAVVERPEAVVDAVQHARVAARVHPSPPHRGASIELPGQAEAVPATSLPASAMGQPSEMSRPGVIQASLPTLDRPTQAVSHMAAETGESFSQPRPQPASPLSQVAIRPDRPIIASLTQSPALGAEGALAANLRTMQTAGQEVGKPDMEPNATADEPAVELGYRQRSAKLFDAVAIHTDPATSRRLGVTATEVAEWHAMASPSPDAIVASAPGDMAPVAEPLMRPAAGASPSTTGTTAVTAELLDFDHDDNAARIARTVAAQLNGRTRGTIRLQLDPPGLGQVRIELAMDREHVRVTLLPATELAAELLGSKLGQLHDSLSSRGLSVGSLTVEPPGRVNNASSARQDSAADQQGGQQGFEQHGRRERQESPRWARPDAGEQPSTVRGETLRIGRARQPDRPARAIDLIG